MPEKGFLYRNIHITQTWKSDTNIYSWYSYKTCVKGGECVMIQVTRWKLTQLCKTQTTLQKLLRTSSRKGSFHCLQDGWGIESKVSEALARCWVIRLRFSWLALHYHWATAAIPSRTVLCFPDTHSWTKFITCSSSAKAHKKTITSPGFHKKIKETHHFRNAGWCVQETQHLAWVPICSKVPIQTSIIEVSGVVLCLGL